MRFLRGVGLLLAVLTGFAVTLLMFDVFADSSMDGINWVLQIKHK